MIKLNQIKSYPTTRTPFLHFMYYMDCKEIFPSPFNPRIHLRYALFKNSSDLKLRNIFKVSQSLTFSIIYKKYHLPWAGANPRPSACETDILPLRHGVLLQVEVNMHYIKQPKLAYSILHVDCSFFAFEIDKLLNK